MKQIEIAAIVFDASTQARAAIDESVVADYADKMLDGVQFPPVVLFHDGNAYYMGDGFHRGLAAQRNGGVTITADVRPGTREDALWFALGANREHGHRMTEMDKQHAVRLALETWPERLHIEIAKQVGCSPSLVSKESSRYTSEAGAHVKTGRALINQQKREAVADLVRQGVRSAEDIAHGSGVSKSFVSKVRAELGMSCFDRTKDGVVKRRAKMREMATSGFTSRQIASELGLSEEGCRRTLRDEGIDVPGDAATKSTHRHDSTRIVEHMVMDAENLTADVNLIDFESLDRSQIAGWLGSLQASRDKLGAFIRRLMKEQQNGQAA